MNQLTVSLWGDEAWAATLISRSLPQVVKLVSHDTSPPLYYILAWGWARLFGFSEPALRSLSLLFHLITSIFTALIARHIYSNKRIPLLAFFLTLLNPFLFQYAFEARMYAILVMMSTISTYFFLKKNWPAYIVSASLSLYCHHFSLFVILWHFLFRLIFSTARRQKFLTLFKPFLLIGLFYLPWLPFMYRQTTMVATQGFWLNRPQLKEISLILLKFALGLNSHPWQPALLALIVLILLLKKWSLKQPVTLFLLGWLFLPIFLVFFISQFAQPIFYDRYLINVIPAFVLLLVSNPSKYTSPLIFIILLFSLLVVDYHFFTHPTKNPFRDLAAYIKASAKPGDALINWSGRSHHLFESKYYQVYAPIYTSQPLPFYTGTALMQPGDQISTLPSASRLGVITSDPLSTVSLPGYHLVDHQQFKDLSFSWWQKN